MTNVYRGAVLKKGWGGWKFGEEKGVRKGRLERSSGSEEMITGTIFSVIAVMNYSNVARQRKQENPGFKYSKCPSGD